MLLLSHALGSQCEKTRNSLSPKKIFRQINSLVKRYFHEFFCQRSKYEVCTTVCVWKIQIFTLTKKNISSNQLVSNLFSKIVTFAKFLPKMREREFP